MRRGFHAAVRRGEVSFFIDDEGGALDAHVLPTIHALFLHHAVQVAHRFVRIREEREIQLILVAEIAVPAHAVPGYAEDGVSERGEVVPVVPEVLRFLRAARGAVLRIEIENHFLPAVVRKRHVLPAVGGKGKVRRRRADDEFVHDGLPFFLSKSVYICSVQDGPAFCKKKAPRKGSPVSRKENEAERHEHERACEKEEDGAAFDLLGDLRPFLRAEDGADAEADGVAPEDVLFPLVARHADEGGDGQHELAGGGGDVRREAEEADHGGDLDDAAADAEGGGDEADAETDAEAERHIHLHVFRVHIHVVLRRGGFARILPDDDEGDEEEEQAEGGAEGAAREPV